MALLFVDGCDSYTDAASVTRRWPLPPDQFAVTTPLTTSGRFDRTCMRASRGGNPGFAGNGRLIEARGGTPGVDDLFIGFSFFFPTPENQPFAIFSLGNSILASLRQYDDTGAYSSHLNQFFVQLNVNGTFSVYNENVLLGTTSVAYTYGTWIRLEFKVAVDASSGVFEMRLNNIPILTFAGNTYNGTGEKAVSTLYTMCGGNNSTRYDDWTINDASGAEFNDWIGDTRIDTLRPNGDVSRDSVVTGGVSASEVLDGVVATAGEYVSLATAGDRDVLDFDNLPDVPDSVLAVAVTVRSQATGTTNRALKTFIADGATEVDGPTVQAPKSAYAYSQSFFGTDPNGLAWSAASINAINVGYEVVF